MKKLILATSLLLTALHTSANDKSYAEDFFEEHPELKQIATLEAKEAGVMDMYEYLYASSTYTEFFTKGKELDLSDFNDYPIAVETKPLILSGQSLDERQLTELKSAIDKNKLEFANAFGISTVEEFQSFMKYKAKKQNGKKHGQQNIGTNESNNFIKRALSDITDRVKVVCNEVCQSQIANAIIREAAMLNHLHGAISDMHRRGQDADMSKGDLFEVEFRSSNNVTEIQVWKFYGHKTIPGYEYTRCSGVCNSQVQ